MVDPSPAAALKTPPAAWEATPARVRAAAAAATREAETEEGAVRTAEEGAAGAEDVEEVVEEVVADVEVNSLRHFQEKKHEQQLDELDCSHAPVDGGENYRVLRTI